MRQQNRKLSVGVRRCGTVGTDGLHHSLWHRFSVAGAVSPEPIGREFSKPHGGPSTASLNGLDLAVPFAYVCEKC